MVSLIKAIAIAAAAYHLIYTQYQFQSTLEQQNTHFAFSLVLVLLTSMRRQRGRWPLCGAVLLLGLAATAYIQVFYFDLLERIGFPIAADLVVGVLLILVALETSRQAYGPIIPGLAAILIAYDFLGHFLPPPLSHPPFTFEYIVSMLSVGFSGMYGTALGVSVNYIFLFFLFGGILQSSGAIDFFMGLGKMAGRRFRGGPAQTAVISSMLVGSVTGSPMANVAITGAFTIPLMKSTGYRPEQAAAIEAAASTGGQVMPPVMGAAAFLMAGITGIPYVKIMVAALVPAILFYWGVAVYAELQARALNIAPLKEEVDIRQMLLKMPNFIVPLGLLVVLMVIGRTPMFAAFWAIVGMIVTSMLTSLLTGERPNVHRLIDGVTIGATGGAQVGVTAAVIGFMMVTLTMTGIGAKLSGLVEDWSMGMLPVCAALTALVCTILGMGVPTLVAYALVALLAAPVMTNMGVPLFEAHFFCFYFACFSAVTPPVALASLVGASIAKGRYFPTAGRAFMICIPTFILPFTLLWNQALILEPRSLAVGIGTIVSFLAAPIALTVTMLNYCIVTLSLRQRIGWALCAVLLFAYGFSMNWVVFTCGMALFVGLFLDHWRMASRMKPEGMLQSAESLGLEGMAPGSREKGALTQ